MNNVYGTIEENNLLHGSLSQSREGLSIQGSLDNDNFLYGELSQKAKKNIYTGGKTNTATVTVDNSLNIITVDTVVDIEEVKKEYEEIKLEYKEVEKYYQQVKEEYSKVIEKYTETDLKVKNLSLDLSNFKSQTTKELAELHTYIDTKVTTVIEELEVKISKLREDVTKIVEQEIIPIKEEIQELKDSLSEIIQRELIPLKEQVDLLGIRVSEIADKEEADVEALNSKINTKVSQDTFDIEMIKLNDKFNEKASGMYLDNTGEKPLWYMTSNNDPLDPHIIAGPYEFGTGGGGGQTTTEVKIEAINWPSTIAFGNSCFIDVNWSSTRDGRPTGNGNLLVYIDDVLVYTQRNNPQGRVTLDISNYIKLGTNTVEVRAIDAYSNFDRVIQNITSIDIKLTSVFNADTVLRGTFNYIYTPYGVGINKVTHFVIDGTDIGTQETRISGEQQTFPISNLTHGSHELIVYFICEIGGNVVKSNELYYDLMYEVEPDETPIITSTFRELEQEQYIAFSIPYRVYTPNHNTSNIQLKVNGEVIQELSVNQDTQYWEYRANDFGVFVLSICCGDIVKSFTIDIKEATIDVHAVTQDLKLYLTATGRSNAEEHPEIWEDKDNQISCTLTGFNFTSDGWIQDNDKNTILRVSGDARVEIPYKPFEQDCTTTGKTIEIEMSTSTVKNYEAPIISCMSGDRGFIITPQIAKIQSLQSDLQTQYKEDDHVRITFVVEKKVETHLILMYINGVMCGAIQYPTGDSFIQLNPVIISIGSNEATTDIYCIRIYDNNLNRKQVVNNWIADTQIGQTKKERFVHNDNYNDSGEIVINKLPTDIPYIVWDIDPLPQFKGDKRPGNVVYKDPQDSSRNFTSKGATYNVQGTSSAVYPVKNIRIKYKKNKDWPEQEFNWLDDNKQTISEFKITKDGIGDNYFTYKVDYASSEGANNVELTKLYNDVAKSLGILTPPQKLDNKVRVGIDGYPIVAFNKTADGKESFCTKANFNNDKANEKVYGFIEGDESWEITNNSTDECIFKKPATPETFANAFEIRFPDEDGYSDLTKLQPMTEWVVSTDPEQATGEPLPEPKQFTYTIVVAAEDGSYHEETVTVPSEDTYFENDTEEYRLAKFKAELKDWFNEKSTIFYYIFTHLFLMIDSRAKNAFPTYFKSRQAGDGGDRWFWLPYDMDTAIGINNEGKLVFDYNLEDTDKIDGTDVYNGQESVMWNNLRKMFNGEIVQMYSSLRTSGSALSFDGVENRFKAHQDKWSENIFNEDSYQKYINVLKQTGANYLEMLQGSKAEQRRWWLYNRFKYFDSKYNAGDAKLDAIQFRAYGVADITITPYADIYASVSYANSSEAFVTVRATRGQSYVLHDPLTPPVNDQETYIYSASQLKSIGDISPFKPGTVDISKAVKLQELKIGDSSPDYKNPNLSSLTLGNNTLLGKLDVRNCTELKTSVDVSGCTNIEEIYFDNTKITGVELPVGGILKKLHLPNTITNLTIRNQKSLNELVIAGTQKVEKLWIENIPSEVIDAKTIIMGMPKGARVRLIGFNQNVNTTQEIVDLYDLLDTMKGLDAQGEATLDKAQVNGNIFIDTIFHTDKLALESKYPDVKIVAQHEICVVTFFNDEEVFATQNIELGKDASDPGVPERPSTQEYWYEFIGWDKPLTNIQEDTDIHALYQEHKQVYRVTFDTQSTLVHVDPQDVEYGSTATRPVDPIIPGATFLGWFKESSTINEFEFTTPIVDNITLYAKWRDDESPVVVDVIRKSYNTFRYEATDNIGITGYAITNSNVEPTEWIEIEPVTPLIGEYTIDRADTYYVWAKDAAGWTGSKSIISYSIEYSEAEGTEISVEENGKLDFAIIGTPLTVNVEIDEHYENLIVYYNEEQISELPYVIEYLDKNILLETTCSRKFYTIQFDTGGKGIKPEDQIIEYLSKVLKPEDQFITGFIIEGWYTNSSFEPEHKWNFNLDVVTGNMTLFANWIVYTDPSVIKINVEESTLDIRCNFTQTSAKGVTVDWGDGTPIDTSGTAIGSTYLDHTYTTAGEKIVKIYCVNGTHKLGGGDGRQVIVPARYITNIEFAWNMPNTSSYALQDAVNLTRVELSEFMSDTAIGLFHGCTNLTEVVIPDSVVEFGGQTFQNCTSLTGEFTIPKSVTVIGSNTFSGCSSITKFILHDNITSIGESAFSNCSGITEFEIPSSINYLPNAILQGCSGLTYIEVPEQIIELRGNTFNGCSSLEKVILRNKDLDITADLTFNACSKLTSAGPIGGDYSIEFAWEDRIPDRAFSVGVNGSNLKSVILPNTIKEIGNYAFALCQKLTSVDLPVGLEVIGNSAFFWDSGITKLVIPESVTSLGEQAFYRCTSLNTFTIPSSVTTIGKLVLNYCYALNNVHIKTPATINKIAIAAESWFLQCSGSLKLYIPKSVIDPNEAYGQSWNYYSTTDTLSFFRED